MVVEASHQFAVDADHLVAVLDEMGGHGVRVRDGLQTVGESDQSSQRQLASESVDRDESGVAACRRHIEAATPSRLASLTP